MVDFQKPVRPAQMTTAFVNAQSCSRFYAACKLSKTRSTLAVEDLFIGYQVLCFYFASAALRQHLVLLASYITVRSLCLIIARTCCLSVRLPALQWEKYLLH